MPTLNFVSQDGIHQLVLLDNRQVFKFGRLNLQRVHRATPTADILDLHILTLAQLLVANMTRMKPQLSACSDW